MDKKAERLWVSESGGHLSNYREAWASKNLAYHQNIDPCAFVFLIPR